MHKAPRGEENEKSTGREDAAGKIPYNEQNEKAHSQLKQTDLD